jgi:hypothetical protein
MNRRTMVLLGALLLRGSAFFSLFAGQTKSPSPPAPYTAIKASADRFECLGRKVKFGALLLPATIQSAKAPLLASPIKLLSQPDFFTGLTGRAKLISKNPESASWEWTGKNESFSARVRLQADCDGFYWYDFQLTPLHPIILKDLRLEIPRTTETSRYLHAANFSWNHPSEGLAEAGGHWQGAFLPYLWLGDEERGLSWCAQSEQGWMLADPGHALKVDTETNCVRLTVQLLDHEQTVSQPIHFSFGLQPSPVKPVSFAWRAKARILHNITFESGETDKNGKIALDTFRDAGVKTVVFHDTWTDYYGKVTTPYGERLKNLIEQCHRRGLRLLVYIGYGLANNAPELTGHREQWSVVPLIPWTSSYRPEFRAFDADCPRSGWSDWLVRGIDRLFQDYQLDGLYFDGTSEAWTCQNTAHGCGWKDASGALHPNFPLLSARSLMRRIADAVHKHRPDAILDVHMSGSLTLPTLAFCDSYWNGEQFESYPTSFSLPLPVFRTEFMGYAHGLDAEFLCYEKRPFTFPEAIALAWVHGVEVRPYPETVQQVSPIWRAMDNIRVASAKWLPYWAGSGASCTNATVKVSAWTGKHVALLVASHLERNKLSTDITIDRSRLGLGKGNLSAKDAISGETVPLQGDNLHVTFNGMAPRFIVLASRGRISTFERWQLSH